MTQPETDLPNDLDIGARVRFMRAARGYSYREAGLVTGFSKGLFQSWEYGYKNPNPEQLEALLEAFEASEVERVWAREGMVA